MLNLLYLFHFIPFRIGIYTQWLAHYYILEEDKCFSISKAYEWRRILPQLDHTQNLSNTYLDDEIWDFLSLPLNLRFDAEVG